MASTRRTTRALVTAAVVSGAAGAGLGMGARSVLRRQAATARTLIGKPLGEQAHDADKVYRRRYTGTPLQLLMVGDSIAAGLGADDRRGTLGARLSKQLAKSVQRPVRLTTVAQVGSESSMLAAQLAALDPAYRPDVAVIIVGGNDVTHRIPVATAAAQLEAAVTDLRSRDCAVVVGTCPDLGALRPVPQPLRSLASRASKQLAAAQGVAARRAGAHVVSLGEVVGPFFVAHPEEMFSLDQFHPSALGYRRTATEMLPSLLAALSRDEVRECPAS